MIEEALANYGVLGIWTLSLLYERYRQQRKMTAIIENNTTAMIKVYEVIQNCPKNKRKA